MNIFFGKSTVFGKFFFSHGRFANLTLRSVTLGNRELVPFHRKLIINDSNFRVWEIKEDDLA